MRIKAADFIYQVQISSFPHWSGPKSDRNLGTRKRRDFIAHLKSLAAGPDPYHDEKGRLVLNTAAQLREWFTSQGLRLN